jgi:hypothetical protein
MSLGGCRRKHNILSDSTPGTCGGLTSKRLATPGNVAHPAALDRALFAALAEPRRFRRRDAGSRPPGHDPSRK